MAWRHAPAHGHAQVHVWAKAQGFRTLATGAQAELGFIRVSRQVFGLSRRANAQTTLADMKRQAGGFVESAPSPTLASCSATAGRTSGAYLAPITAHAGLVRATFDTGIPDAGRI